MNNNLVRTEISYTNYWKQQKTEFANIIENVIIYFYFFYILGIKILQE